MHATHVLRIIAAAALLTACAKLPEGRSAVDDVTMNGAERVSASDVTDQLATTASPKFLGLFRGVVYDYEILDDLALQRDLARVERYYRARGYYGAHARAARILPTGARHVRVEIVVEEGEPIAVKDVRVLGLDDVAPELAAEIERTARRRLRAGAPFDEDDFTRAESEVRRALTDHGYAYAKVTSDAFVDVAQRTANAVFTVNAGPTATFGKVTIVGLDPDRAGPAPQEIPEEPLLRAIDIKEGDPYSTAALDAALQALLDLEVFSSVELVPDLPDPPPPSHVVPVTVKVEPSRLRQVRIGGGLEFDQIKTDVHALFGWEDHNFLGGLRDFSVDVKPGAVLYPTRINYIVVPERILPEERLRVQLKQPGFLEARTNGFLRPEFNVFPLLVKTNPNPDDPVVIGYAEFKGSAGVDRVFWKFFASVGYNAQVEAPFSYKGDLDPALRTLVISYPELITHLDLRDDRIHTHKGVFVANDLQIAGGPFFGDATDVKVQPEVRTYLPVHRRITFATRGTVGLLFPANYGDVVKNPTAPATQADRVRDIETMYFRGFFSGGASSNRGFPIRGISPHGVVPFLNPQTAAQQVALKCDPTTNPNPDPTLCSIPIGGFTLWELSNELRFNVSGPFSAATFCDMSDVSPRPANIRLDHLHLSCGLGARYETPVGPIRLDVGYRVQPLQVLGYRSETAAHAADSTEGPQPTLLGLPVAISIGIGEAY